MEDDHLDALCRCWANAPETLEMLVRQQPSDERNQLNILSRFFVPTFVTLSDSAIRLPVLTSQQIKHHVTTSLARNTVSPRLRSSPRFRSLLVVDTDLRVCCQQVFLAWYVEGTRRVMFVNVP